jgi:hypothetical protein
MDRGGDEAVDAGTGALVRKNVNLPTVERMTGQGDEADG